MFPYLPMIFIGHTDCTPCRLPDAPPVLGMNNIEQTPSLRYLEKNDN